MPSDVHKNGHSINHKSSSVYPLLGVWILDETVRVVFAILLHIIATLWAEVSVPLTVVRTKCSLYHYILNFIRLPWVVIRKRLEAIGWNSCYYHYHRLSVRNIDFSLGFVINRQFMLIVPPLKAMDCYWQTHCDETLISRIELGLTKKLH